MLGATGLIEPTTISLQIRSGREGLPSSSEERRPCSEKGARDQVEVHVEMSLNEEPVNRFCHPKLGYGGFDDSVNARHTQRRLSGARNFDVAGEGEVGCGWHTYKHT